ncbi:ABC transporter substrate-binding protein [Nostoc sp. CHAB 5836]|uniref:ABC transporter substrate-binding protein n=1 Tax=Nostoc sp. CHAB 5836 TaxID=2780404 RepID=UPI001E394310|nr:ABC transporter substrate-binding protein [Nostoc sp. CHAB 5836]MCC5613746.1 ABC transporter substrate-binding protein [Nostoc sp. CHAB 5836]
MVQSSSSPQLPKNVAVVLRISAGSFVDGFSVSLQILEDGQIIQEHDDLPLIPAAPEIPQLYQEWQNISLEGSRQLQAVSGQVTNVANVENWRQRTQRLEDYCRRWFQDRAFSSLRDRIRANTRIRTDQSVPIIIRCPTQDQNQNELLRRLPWHVWDLFTNLPNGEFALFTNFRRQVATLEAPVRVLAIFGSSQGGLQLEEDQAALEILQQRGAEIIRQSEPSEETLSRLLFDEDWDILFFAGHSSSQGTSGQIQISQGNFLPLHALRQSLTRAVTRGLKLAIFNSCDGLGIADFLAGLNVPALIVMREPVPDRIACQFLLYFLREFSQGTPLCLAVREARDRLESIQSIFPAASWLPVVCVNPNQPELVWPVSTPPIPITRPESLLSRLRSYFRRHYFITIGFAAFALIVIIPQASPIACQIFPSICQPPIADNRKSLDRQKPIEDFISYGEKSIANSKVQLSEPYLSLKLQGIKAFSQGKYKDAVSIFDDLRSQAQHKKSVPGLYSQAQHKKSVPGLYQKALAALQDPEILIYRNNAFVNDRHIQNPNLPIYTIAVAAPLNLDAGLGIVFGVAQAQDVAVKQKISLQVVIANDSNSPDQAQQVAEILSKDGKILAVVGHYTSPNTCAALKVYSPKELVLISPTSTVVNLQSNPNCGGDPNKVFFRTVSSTRVEAHSLVQYLVDDLKKPQPKVVVFYNSKESFSKDLFNQFVQVIKAFKGGVIATFDLSDLNFDTSQLPPEVKDADALAVLADGQTNDTEAFQKAINIIKLNNGKKPVLGSNSLYLQEVINQAKDTTVNRLFLAVDWHQKQCGAAAFAKQINEYWGGDLNRRTALAYEAVQAVLQAIKLSSNSPVTRQDIQQKLSETGIIPGVAASSAIIEGFPISFDATGDRREFTTRAIVTVNNKLRFDLVKDVPCPK